MNTALIFFADHNSDGLYDAPPVDHAWRVEYKVETDGDDTTSFSHNTDFYDIEWPYRFVLDMDGMTPHLGQAIYMRVVDLLTRQEVGRASLDALTESTYSLAVSGTKESGKYRAEFFADLNGNGLYDDPPVDHTWYVDAEAGNGDVHAAFSHNTNFAALDWGYVLELEISGLSPHLNEFFEARLVEQSTEREISRTRLDAVYDSEFSLFLAGMRLAKDYYVDFYADHNGNGIYDAPPTDHAWRLSYSSGDDGDDNVSFSHNTNFTDIDWAYAFTLNLTGLTPHLSEYFEMRMVNTATTEEVGRVSVDAVPAADFSISMGGMHAGQEYNVDFYADHNGNGQYDAPPTDHAWRLTFAQQAGDTALNFSHNTNFTDIQFPTSLFISTLTPVKEFALLGNYPNPFNPSTVIRFTVPFNQKVNVSIYDINGRKIRTLVNDVVASGYHQVKWDGRNSHGQHMAAGMYFYTLTSSSRIYSKKMILIK